MQRTSGLHNLLLDKETLQVTQLVETGTNQYNQLYKSPLDHSGVGRFRLVSEHSFSFPHVLLFVVNLFQLCVQVLYLGCQAVNLFCGLGVSIVMGTATGNVKEHTVGLADSTVIIDWFQAELVFTSFVGSESEFSTW